MPSSYQAPAGYQQQPTPPPPYTPSMSPMSQMNQQMGHMMQPNSVNQSMGQINQPVGPQMGPQMPPVGPLNQMSQMSPMSQMPQVPQGPQLPSVGQIPQPGMYGPHLPQQGPRPMQRRRKSTPQYPNATMANAMSPPVTPGAMPSPYMSISDAALNPSNCYDIKPQVVPNTASPQAYEDVKPTRLNSKWDKSHIYFLLFTNRSPLNCVYVVEYHHFRVPEPLAVLCRLLQILSQITTFVLVKQLAVLPRLLQILSQITSFLLV